MRWFRRLIWSDKRIRRIALGGAFGLFLVLAGLILPLAWLTKVGLWFGLPLLVGALLGMLGLTALLVVRDQRRYSG